MQKEQIITKIKECGLVAVVRATSGDQAARIAEACIEGGVAAIELTFTVPKIHHIIEEMATRYGDNGDIIIGAGTVLDPETARIAILSGAQYVVSPSFNEGTMKMCGRYRVPVMPGVLTPGEVMKALEAGADICKVFPGELFGPKIIKSLKGPIPQGQYMPTGGVDPSNVADWIKAGAVAVGAGSSLTKGEPKQIVATAKEFLKNIQEARASLAK